MSRIWIINQYASIPKTGIGGRHRHLGRELAARGHAVTVIGASWSHVHSKDIDPKTLPFKEEFEGFTYVHLPVPKYRDAHDKMRIRNWFLFTAKLLTLPKKLREVPDVILVSSPSPFPFLAAERLARKHGARLVFEVRDIWPMTLTEIGGYKPSHPMIRLMQWVEDRAYRNSDAVISNLPSAVEHMVSRGMPAEKFTWVPNGFSATEVNAATPLSPEIAAQLPEDKCIVGYAGTVGAANALDVLIDAACQFRNDPHILFVIVGEGRDKPELQRLVSENRLRNVKFLPAVPKSEVPSILQYFDICYIGWRDAALYRYGIAANKLFDYFVAENPVLHAYSGANDHVADYNAGYSVPSENSEKIAEAIRTMEAMNAAELKKMGRRGKKAVYRHHEYSNIAETLEKVLVMPKSV